MSKKILSFIIGNCCVYDNCACNFTMTIIKRVSVYCVDKYLLSTSGIINKLIRELHHWLHHNCCHVIFIADTKLIIVCFAENLLRTVRGIEIFHCLFKTFHIIELLPVTSYRYWLTPLYIINKFGSSKKKKKNGILLTNFTNYK